MESEQGKSSSTLKKAAEVSRLVLTRRENQQLIFRPLGVSSEFDVCLTVVETAHSKSRIAVECIREVNIVRGEIEDIEAKPSRLCKGLEVLRRLLCGEISQIRAAKLANELGLFSMPRISGEIIHSELMD